MMFKRKALALVVVCVAQGLFIGNAQSQTAGVDTLLQKRALFYHVDSLLQLARDRGARKYAPVTFSRAQKYRATAGALFTDRGAESKALKNEIAKAEYDARHTLYITEYVRGLDRRDYDYERLILLSEALLQKGADPAGARLHFDKGLSSAAAKLAAVVTSLTDSIQSSQESADSVTRALKEICVNSGIHISDTADITEILPALNEEFGALVREGDEMRGELKKLRERLDEVEYERQRTVSQLTRHEEEERKFQTIKSLFTLDEALVMYSASQDVVIRLRGLVFQSGVSSLSPQHLPLLDKVIAAMNQFSDKRVIIEGHTDNTGSAKDNRSVSLRRAQAVREYLIEKSGRSPDQFEALGYGADKPVANNQTAAGRAENRRIDVVILRSESR